MSVLKSIQKFLNDARLAYIDDQQNKGIRASGRSADSTFIEFDESGGQVMGSGYFKFQFVGRGPGGFPPIEDILTWIRTKNIQSEISENSLAYLIARKIARQGTDIYQGKRPGLSLESKLADLRKELSQALLKDAQLRVVETFKKKLKL